MSKLGNAAKRAGCSVGVHDKYTYDARVDYRFDPEKNKARVKYERITKCQLCSWTGSTSYFEKWE